MDFDELVHALRTVFVYGLVKAVYDDGQLQTVDVLTHDGSLRTRVPVMQFVGFASVPTQGAVVSLLPVGNDPAAMIALPPFSTWRFGGLSEGEAVMYAADGTRVALRTGGIVQVLAATRVEMSAGSANVTITAATTVAITAPNGVTIGGNVAVTGNITASGDVSDSKGSMAQIRSIYDGHSHPANGQPPTQQM